MSKFNWNKFKVPTTCGECEFIRHYKDGPYKRNPHCCCELWWFLAKDDYKVKENTLDENCPIVSLENYLKGKNNDSMS